LRTTGGEAISKRPTYAELEQRVIDLEHSEQDFQGFFNNANDAIIVFEPEKEIVLEANKRAFDLYGYSREEFIGMSLSQQPPSKKVAWENPHRG